MPDYLILIFVAVLGLALGSFFNVVIYRLPLDQSLVRPGSRCTICKRTLAWYENIPVFSWLVLGGRCRTCKTPISPIYPLVEIATSVVAVAWYLHFGPGLPFASQVVFAFALIVLFVIDLQHRILPNVITLPGIIVGFLFSLAGPLGWASLFSRPAGPPGLANSLAGILLGGGLLWGIGEAYYRIRGEEGMGMGDVKMIGMIGAFLGWQQMLLALVVSSLLGSVVGLAMIVAKRGNMKYALPFGSFLTIGALIASIAGVRIIAWYLSFF
jgi:leader peptidase (prepilin peptidase)/N-methyltransferase